MRPTISPRQIIFYALLLLVCAAVGSVYIAGMDWDEPNISLAELMSGTAHKPFVGRVLLPALGLLTSAGLGITPEAAVAAWIYLSLFGSSVALLWLCAAFWPGGPRHEIAALLLPLAAMPLSLAFRHIYDLPTLFLFTLGLAALAHRRWRAFLVIFAVACLNRETTILLSLVFALWYARRLEPPLFWRLLLMQAGIFLLIRLPLLWQFRDNPGRSLSFYLDVHMRVYAERPALALVHLLIAALIALACAHAWRQKPPGLRRAALALVGVLVPLFLVAGFPFEVRVFYEALPLVYLLALPLSRQPTLPSAPLAPAPGPAPAGAGSVAAAPPGSRRA
jgi:hypothetical protein